MQCPLCNKDLYSGLGLGCVLCGMPLDGEAEEFCCEDCSLKYKKMLKGGLKNEI